MAHYWNSRFNTSFSMHMLFALFSIILPVFPLIIFMFLSTVSVVTSVLELRDMLLCSQPSSLCWQLTAWSVLHPTASNTYPDVCLTYHLKNRRRNWKIRRISFLLFHLGLFFPPFYLKTMSFGARGGLLFACYKDHLYSHHLAVSKIDEIMT